MTVFKRKGINLVEIFNGVFLKKAIDSENNSKSVTLGEITIDPGCGLPLHKHTVEDCMFIIEGKGKLFIGKNQYFIEEGDQILVPAGSHHSLENIGKEKLRLIFTYPSVNVARTLIK